MPQGIEADLLHQDLGNVHTYLALLPLSNDAVMQYYI